MDTAASAQTHISVINAMNKYYSTYRSNCGRGDYGISNQATEEVDLARSKVAKFIGCETEQVMFTTGATHGLNLVAEWHRSASAVIITELEHNANIVPWMAQGRTVENGRLIVIPSNDAGGVDLSVAQDLIEDAPNDSFLSITDVSNVSGTMLNTLGMLQAAKNRGFGVCVDACQSVPHGCHLALDYIDYIVFSAHKMYGPVGIGALYAKPGFDILRATTFGGGAVSNVTFNQVEFADGVAKHEPGTPNIAAIIGFGVACELYDYVSNEIILDKLISIHRYINKSGLLALPGLRPLAYSLSTDPLTVLTYIPEKVHSSDIAVLLSRTNLAVRTGRLCAHPYVDKVSKGKGVVRLSWGLYTTENDFVQAKEILEDTMIKFGG